MLIGNRDGSEIHALYATGKHDEVARSYYFNSWMGGGQQTSDRLLTLLSDLDVGKQEDPRFDRGLDFVQPDDRALFRFERRGKFDFEVLKRLFGELPRGVSDSSARLTSAWCTHQHSSEEATALDHMKHHHTTGAG